MHESQRSSSARSNGGSRRRRWEVKSKEAFETSLAVEICSPEKKNQHATREPTNEPSTDSSDKTSNCNKRDKQYPKSSSPKLSSQNHEVNKADVLSSRISALLDEASAKPKETSRKSSKGKDKQIIADQSDSELGEEVRQHYADDEKRPPGNTILHENNIKESEIIPFGEKEKAQIFYDKFETKSLKEAGIQQTEGVVEPSVASAPPMSPEPQVPKKKKRKKKSESKLLLVSNANEESYISLQLKEMDEDVIDVSRDDEGCVLSAPNLLFAASTSNHPGNISTVYQEKIEGFVVTKDFMGVQKKSEDIHDINQITTRSSHAIFLQSGFRTFSVLCQGLLAGVTLAHCLFVSILLIPVLYTYLITVHVIYNNSDELELITCHIILILYPLMRKYNNYCTVILIHAPL